ncbi:MAG TPA: hypothetical protein VN844_19525 [Pyrinomonadaceae bacterium]|nr:hypothetical protein [Pyrinomonadaceae bacterium]
MQTLTDIAVTTEAFQRFLFFPEDESALSWRDILPPDLRSSIVSDGNIVGICTQFKYVEGKATDVPTITFIVVKKKSRSQLRRGQHFNIPPELPAFDPKKGGFSGKNKIRTDVEESGGISLCARAKRGVYIDRKRPVSGGLSVGNAKEKVTGTLGFWVELVEKGVIGVSNYHVLANPNARKGERIVQPGRLDHRGSRNTIGNLLEFFPYEKGGNLVDFACLTPRNPAEADLFNIEAIGKWNGFTKAVEGMRVAKVGRTTGYTEGEIQSLDATFQTSYDDEPLLFIKQIKTTCKMEEGDSGAALVDLKSKKICGLCVATDNIASVSYANNIRYLFGPDSQLKWKLKK